MTTIRTDATLGTDFEIFVTDNNNGILPPMALVQDFGGNLNKISDKLVVFEHKTPRGIVSITSDGAASELWTLPYKNWQTLQQDVLTALEAYDVYVQKLTGGKFFVNYNTIMGDLDVKKYWEGRDENFLDCVRIGCQPDQHPYVELLQKTPPRGERRLIGDPLRFAGGHLQISTAPGMSNMYIHAWRECCVVLDSLLGMYNVTIPRPDEIVKQEQKRLEQYGTPGRIRLQNYPNGARGIEYRPPSGWWAYTRDDAIWGKMYNLLDLFHRVVLKPDVLNRYVDYLYDQLSENYDILTSFDSSAAKAKLDNYLSYLKGQDSSLVLVEKV